MYTTPQHLPSLTIRAEAGDPTAMLELAQALDLQNDRKAWDWAQKASSLDYIPAQTQAAAWQIAGRHIDRDTEQGFKLMLSAAKAGDLVAQQLVSVLYSSGYIGEADWDAALTWLIRAAKSGYVSALRQIAFLMRPLPHLRPLRHTLYYAAASAGDSLAAYLLGEDLCASGDSAENALGVGWILYAAENGNAAANLHANTLVGRKMRQPVAPFQVKRIPWGDIKRLITLPHTQKLTKAETLSDSPNITVRRGMLGATLCDYMISVGAEHLSAATVHDAQAGEIADDSRTNSFANFRLLESDVVVQSINTLIMNAMNHPVSHADPLSLLHYRPGQSYRPHYDFFDPDYPAHQHHLDGSGQRIKTGLVYLNENYSGGATRFCDVNMDFKGGLGDFLCFDNLLPDGSPDRKTLHSGEPPIVNEKWLLSKWARASHVPL